MPDKIDAVFEKFLTNKPVFQDKKVLQANYLPDGVLHRETEIEQIGNILAPSLRRHKPSNLFLYGKPGTGKTLTTLHVTNKLSNLAAERNIPLKVLYLNCKLKKIADTEYRLVAQMVRQLGREIPSTGLPTGEVYQIFFQLLDQKEQLLLVVLDEVDQLVKKTGDEILYNLTRINAELKHAQLAIIGISNDLLFMEGIDPRVKSSLSEEELFFPSYNALQLQDILKNRAATAFQDKAIQVGVIEKCSAFAAKEHGDARRALDLLRVAGEVAEREGSPTVELEHIDKAEDKIERDSVLDAVMGQPKQFQAALFAVLQIATNKQRLIQTGEVYVTYKQVCDRINLRPLTQRRISDVLAEMDMLGIINAKVISKGRYGRTRKIEVSLGQSIEQKLRETLSKELGMVT